MNYGVIFFPSIHDFIPLTKRYKEDTSGKYHLFNCSKCNIKGKQYEGESCLTLIKKYPTNLINCCILKQTKDPFVGKTIKIKQCYAAGSNYNNCSPNSIHKIVEPLYGQINGDRGVWVQGKYQPIKIFFDEFDFMSLIRTNKKLKRTK